MELDNLFSYFRTFRSVSLTTQMPPHVTIDTLLDALHDHEFMIKLNPLVITMERISLEDNPVLKAHGAASDASAYRIEESIQYFGRITFTAAFMDEADGCTVIVNAPLGLIIRSKYQARQTSALEDQGGCVSLEETGSLEANLLLMPFIKSNYESTHRHLHQDLCKHVSTIGTTGGGTL